MIKNFSAHFRQCFSDSVNQCPIFVIFALVKMSSFLLLSGVLAGTLVLCSAASPQIPQIRQPKGVVMGVGTDEAGDTVYLDQIDPIWVFPRGKGMKKGDWRRYYKTVYNFNKIYPYALACRKLMAQVDRELAIGGYRKSDRTHYINQVEKELFKLFEKDIWKMTVSQGVLLVRLIDRECGMSGYEIIKNYESGFAAGFWQLVAKLFDQDLKSRYDPKGKDEKTEQLIQIWDSGNWKLFYFSIFFDYPEETVIRQDSLQVNLRRSLLEEKSRRRNSKGKR